MMEIQILRDSDDDYCNEEMTSLENTTESSPQNSIEMSMHVGQNSKKIEDVKLVRSFLLNSSHRPEIVHDFMNQVSDSHSGIREIFPDIAKTNDGSLLIGQNTDADSDISANLTKRHDMLDTFAVDGEMDVTDDNPDDTLLNDATGDPNNSSTHKDFSTDKPRYVIFSRNNDSSGIASMEKGNAEQFTVTMSGANTDNCYPNMQAVNLGRHSGGGENDGLGMIFEVVGEISTPDGQAFMREMATQTQPPHKHRYSKTKRKDSDLIVASGLPEQDISTQAGDKRFKCNSCGLKFLDEETRDVHQKCHKESMRDYHCFFCDFSAPQWTKMHLHLFEHGVKKPYKCQHCSFDCKNKSDLTSHMAVHSSEKQFKCPRCNRQYKHRRNVVAHLRTCPGVDETGKPQKTDDSEKFVCPICNRKLSTKKNRDKHMEIHTNIKPFVCKTCGHATRLKESLLMHERLHTGEKPFKCDMCDYATPDKSSLRRHIRTHTKEKPYKCNVCSYSCIQKHCLDTHIRRKHTGEQFVCGVCRYATHDRYGLNQHFKKHLNADGTLSQCNVQIMTQENSQQNTSSILDTVQDAGSTYVGMPPPATLKPASDSNRLGEGSQTKSLTNPVILHITHASNLGTDQKTTPSGLLPEKGSCDIPENASASTSTVNVNRSQEASVELAGIEATLVQQIQQPGDEVFFQPTGEIIIKRQDGHLLVIQRRDDLEGEVDLEETVEEEYYAAVPLSDISATQNSGDCDVADNRSEDFEESSPQKCFDAN